MDDQRVPNSPLLPFPPTPLPIQAERRQKAHIQAIARKAENETSKVKEVSFINNLTAEGLRITITERLTEVEKRIQAGRARRLQHLHGIKNRQRKKREKAMQMSERRLEMEQMAAERWVSLQARVEAVQERRQTRLLEMQRYDGSYWQDAISPLACTISDFLSMISPFYSLGEPKWPRAQD